jgi:endonuclease/exonuclease/phosphatase family metal-dependent hydrolase
MPSEPFRVLTFNILGSWDLREGAGWAERQERVVGVIAQAAPDLVGLQEATAVQRATLDAKLPGLRRVPVHPPEGAPNREHEEALNTILYRPTRFRYEAGGIFWLGVDPARPALDWDAAFPRCATWARFTDLADGVPLLFIATHLDHESDRARAESAALILEFLALTHTAPGARVPVIIVGDFNADASTDLHQRFLEGPPPFRDAWEETRGGAGAPYTDGTFHDFTGKPLTDVGRIDWILFTGSLRPLEARVVEAAVGGHYPSDHFPILALFSR